MAGAIAGTAILRAQRPTHLLDTVTLTINNSCNLACPHCYLQYAGPPQRLPADVVSLLVETRFRHLAIVGKEPLADSLSAALCDRIIHAMAESGKTVSLITNGVGLRRLSTSAASRLAFIDVSFDGGPATYERYRGAPFMRLVDTLNSISRTSATVVNALHVINDLTITNIDDMVSIADHIDVGLMMFSPYLMTLNDGTNCVSSIPLQRVVLSLARSQRFIYHPSTLLLVDAQHLEQDHLRRSDFEALVSDCGLAHKIRIFDDDPLTYGFIRITYDGYVLRPYDSVHPSLYSETGYRLNRGTDLTTVLREFRTAA